MKKTFFTLTFLTLSAIPALVAAQGPGESNTTPPGENSTTPVPLTFKIQNPFKVGDNLFELMQSILTNIIMPIGGILCVLAFIWGGFQYVTAQGKPEAIKNANRTLLYAAIGTAILLGAEVIALLVRTTLTELLTI